MSIWKYLKTGFKLMLVLAFGSLIMFIPQIIAVFTVLIHPMVSMVLYIVCSIVGLTLNGYLIVKYRNWIFKK